MKSERSRKSNLVSIASVLRQSQKKTQQAFTVSRLRKDWSNIVGELLANRTRPKKIERNVLWVSVDNGALHYELSLMKPALLEKIHSLSSAKYKDIKFVHEPVEGAEEKIEATPSRQKFIRTPAEESESLESILKRIRAISKDLQKKRSN